MEIDPNVISAVRGKKIKKKKDKWRIFSTIFIISFIVFSSCYIFYWYFTEYPNVLGEDEQKAVRLNQTLILQGKQETYDLITNLRINCQPLILNYTNQDNQIIYLSYIPVEGCLSQNQINCIIKNENE